jgi:hypothetical protein
MLRTLIAPTLALCLLPGTGAASVEDAKAARVMFTAFECSAYASMMGEDARRKQLVDVGVAAGRQFLAALAAGEISEGDLRQHAPFMMGTDTDQPSPDFLIGRMYDGTFQAMHQKVSSKDKAGTLLPEDQWLYEGDDFEAKAKWHYQTANCDLL